MYQKFVVAGLRPDPLGELDPYLEPPNRSGTLSSAIRGTLREEEGDWK